MIKSQQRFRSDHHREEEEEEEEEKEVNKIALSSNDYKRIKTFDKVTKYPYETNTFKVCGNEMLLLRKYVVIFKK